MVDAISGTGADRALSRQEVLVDRADEIRRARVAEATSLRALAEVTAPRAPQAAERQAVSQEALTGRPRLADLLRDPETVNRLIDQTQSVDRGRRLQEARRLQVQEQGFDAVRQAYSSAFFDPGRAGTILGMRESIKPPGQE